MDQKLYDRIDAQPYDASFGLRPRARSPLKDVLSRLVADGRRLPGLAESLEILVAQGFGELPAPGGGKTCERFERLAEVSALSLPLAKLYEAHTDAMAIFTELAPGAGIPQGTWGVFAAESQPPALFVETSTKGELFLNGVKDWCSGALDLSHALVTARSASGQPLLLAVELRDPRIVIVKGPWAAVGMAQTETARIEFRDLPCTRVGQPSEYLSRPGFWHGAIGVAACWYGGAALIASKLHTALLARHDEHGLAHLGSVIAAMDSARFALTAAAHAIDAHPKGNQRALALSVRAIVESACREVLDHAGRALGAKPFCMDAQFAAMAADLPVFLRQSHAERDLAELGALALKKDMQWTRFSNAQ